MERIKDFMEDFSLIDQKRLPSIVIWEKYLVYATAFGIADKVIKQLKIVYQNLMRIHILIRMDTQQFCIWQ